MKLVSTCVDPNMPKIISILQTNVIHMTSFLNFILFFWHCHFSCWLWAFCWASPIYMCTQNHQQFTLSFLLPIQQCNTKKIKNPTNPQKIMFESLSSLFLMSWTSTTNLMMPTYIYIYIPNFEDTLLKGHAWHKPLKRFAHLWHHRISRAKGP